MLGGEQPEVDRPDGEGKPGVVDSCQGPVLDERRPDPGLGGRLGGDVGNGEDSPRDVDRRGDGGDERRSLSPPHEREQSPERPIWAEIARDEVNQSGREHPPDAEEDERQDAREHE